MILERKNKLLITRLMTLTMIALGLCGGYFIGRGNLLGLIFFISGTVVLISKWKLESVWEL